MLGEDVLWGFGCCYSAVGNRCPRIRKSLRRHTGGDKRAHNKKQTIIQGMELAGNAQQGFAGVLAQCKCLACLPFGSDSRIFL